MGFHLFNEFIYSMNSFIFAFHLLHGFIYYTNSIIFFLYEILQEFTYVCLYEILGVDTMATKEAKKRMKASEHKKRKLL
jgi:hypothetical protein